MDYDEIWKNLELNFDYLGLDYDDPHIAEVLCTVYMFGEENGYNMGLQAGDNE